MSLRKWRTNSDDFRATIPEHLVETADLSLPSAHNSPKALGIHWQVTSDALHVAIPIVPPDKSVTKRQIASITAQVYDILGLFAPCVIVAKLLLLQQLWRDKINWDDITSTNIQQQWKVWTDELPLITNHPVPRRYSPNSSPIIATSLQGFSDASKLAYGAAVQVHADGSVSTALVYAKACVYPLKSKTIPQMELQAATMLADLIHYVASTLKISLQNVHPWTDSEIVIHWLRRMPCTLDAFISHRVARIQDTLPDSSWHHVTSADNPADLASRGTTAMKLTESDLWWHGPPWLRLPESQWPPSGVGSPPRELPGTKMVMLTAITAPASVWNFWTRYSSFSTLLRTLAWMKHLFRIARIHLTKSAQTLSPPRNSLTPNYSYSNEHRLTPSLMYIIL